VPLETAGRAVDVSRETTAPVAVERPPDAAGMLFGHRLPLAERFAAHLAGSGVERGLIGPREAERVWTRHLLNCAVVADLVPPRARLVDVGSGAGLPGLALAVARPDLEVVLVEPLARRCGWLEEVVADLGLAVEVRRGRVEDVGRPGEADVVTARAVAPLDRLVRWCLPLLRPDGELLAIKGRTAADEVRRTAAAVRRAGGTDPDVVSCGTGALAGVTTVVRVRVAPT
jgi:16S rRNA (guanine527-N7)-methyltransferase